MMQEWTTRKMWALGLVVLSAALLPAAIPAPLERRPNCAGAPGIGDTYYPTYGNGGYDVGRYKLKVAYDPATDRLDGKATVLARSTQRLCSFNFDFVGMDVHQIKVNGDRAGLVSQRPGADRDPARRPEERARLSGSPSRTTASRRSSRSRGSPDVRTGFMDDPRGRHGRRSARGRSRLVPGQRPPARQGLLRLRRHGAEGLRGRRERVPARREEEGRPDHLELARQRADGLLPGDDRHRALGRHRADPGRAAELRRDLFRDHRARTASRDRSIRWPARARSWTCSPPRSGPTHSKRSAGSCPTRTICSSRWRPRPVRSTRSCSGSMTMASR